MILTSFQVPEIRDSNDNIIQEGTYGKKSPLANKQNTGAIDYINNNLMAHQRALTALGVSDDTSGAGVNITEAEIANFFGMGVIS